MKGDWRGALRVRGMMARARIPPTVHVYNALLAACERARQWCAPSPPLNPVPWVANPPCSMLRLLLVNADMCEEVAGGQMHHPTALFAQLCPLLWCERVSVSCTALWPAAHSASVWALVTPG